MDHQGTPVLFVCYWPDETPRLEGSCLGAFARTFLLPGSPPPSSVPGNHLSPLMLLRSSLLLEASPTVSALIRAPTFSWAYPSCSAGRSCTICFHVCPRPLTVRLVRTETDVLDESACSQGRTLPTRSSCQFSLYAFLALNNCNSSFLVLKVIYIPDRTFFYMQRSKRNSNQSLHHHHLSIKIITVPILAYFFQLFFCVNHLCLF